MRPLRAGLVGLAGLLLLTGCSGLEGTGDVNFTTGGGIVQIAPDDRTDPIEISGPSLQDEPVDLAELRGEVVVLNVWGSWCNPCRDEAPVLAEASTQLDAAFVGMSFREDSFDRARAFEREFDITYPTIADTGEGVLELGRYAPRSPPTTYVLDRQGRVAALFTGVLTSAGTLEDVVTEVAAEDG